MIHLQCSLFVGSRANPPPTHPTLISFPCSCHTSILEAKDFLIPTPPRSRSLLAESLRPCVRSAGASNEPQPLPVRLAPLQSFVPSTPVAAFPKRSTRLRTRKDYLSDIMRTTIAFRGKLKILPRSPLVRKKTSRSRQRPRDPPKREASEVQVEEVAAAWTKQKARAQVQVLLPDHPQETHQR